MARRPASAWCVGLTRLQIASSPWATYLSWSPSGCCSPGLLAALRSLRNSCSSATRTSRPATGVRRGLHRPGGRRWGAAGGCCSPIAVIDRVAGCGCGRTFRVAVAVVGRGVGRPPTGLSASRSWLGAHFLLDAYRVQAGGERCWLSLLAVQHRHLSRSWPRSSSAPASRILPATPVRYGWNWDRMVIVEAGYGPLPPHCHRTARRKREPAVTAWSLVAFAGAPGGRKAGASPGVEPRRGDVVPPVMSGRTPSAAHEIAIRADHPDQLGMARR